LKFQATAEKTAKHLKGLFFLSHPVCIAYAVYIIISLYFTI